MSGRKYSFAYCKNAHRSSNKGLRIHTFPSNTDLIKKWIINSGMYLYVFIYQLIIYTNNLNVYLSD